MQRRIWRDHVAGLRCLLGVQVPAEAIRRDALAASLRGAGSRALLDRWCVTPPERAHLPRLRVYARARPWPTARVQQDAAPIRRKRAEHPSHVLQARQGVGHKAQSGVWGRASGCDGPLPLHTYVTYFPLSIINTLRRMRFLTLNPIFNSKSFSIYC